MNTSKLLVTPLRILLGLVFVGLLFGQTLALPGQFAHWANEGPSFTQFRWPMTAFTVLELLCVQVVIVCTWRLLGMVKKDRIFSTEAFVWVNTIVGAITVAWALLLGFSAFAIGYLFVTPELRDPGLPIMLLGLTAVGLVVVLLMFVMRALLRQAAVLQADMEVVI